MEAPQIPNSLLLLAVFGNRKTTICSLSWQVLFCGEIVRFYWGFLENMGAERGFFVVNCGELHGTSW
jgi:hypothetical protein